MRRPPWLGRAVRVALLLAALAVCGIELTDRWSEVRSNLERIGPEQILGALGLVAVAQFAVMMSWRALMVDLGSRIPPRGAARIVWLSALGKFVPGSVWPYLAQVEMGRRYRVPRTRSAAVSITAVLVSLVSALLIAAVTMPWSSPSAARRFWPVFLAAPLVGALLHPRVLNRLLSVGLRILRRPAIDERVSLRGMAACTGWAALAWVALGLQIWVLATAVANLAATGMVVSIGAYALAWSAGFLFVVAPAGAGVREAALIAALSPVMSTSAALTVAILARAMTTAGDIGAAGIAGLLRPGQSEPGTETPTECGGKAETPPTRPRRRAVTPTPTSGRHEPPGRGNG